MPTGDRATGTADQDRKTAKTYTPDGAVKTLTASNPMLLVDRAASPSPLAPG